MNWQAVYNTLKISTGEVPGSVERKLSESGTTRLVTVIQVRRDTALMAMVLDAKLPFENILDWLTHVFHFSEMDFWKRASSFSSRAVFSRGNEKSAFLFRGKPGNLGAHRANFICIYGRQALRTPYQNTYFNANCMMRGS